MATSERERVPTLNISIENPVSLILLLSNAAFNTSVSTKPSLEPLRTLSFHGSATDLIG